jgi:hypothetical protein
LKIDEEEAYLNIKGTQTFEDIDTLVTIKNTFSDKLIKIKHLISQIRNLNVFIRFKQKISTFVPWHPKGGNPHRDQIKISIREKIKERKQFIRLLKSEIIDLKKNLIELDPRFLEINNSDIDIRNIERLRSCILENVNFLYDYLKGSQSKEMAVRCVNAHIENMAESLDSLCKCIDNSIYSISPGEFSYLKIEKWRGDSKKNLYGNFNDAVMVALNHFKGADKKILNYLFPLDNGQQMVIYPSFRIKKYGIPLLYRTQGKNGSKAWELGGEYIVYLEITAAFDFSKIIDSDNQPLELFYDCHNKLIWTKDTGKYIVYEELPEHESVESLLGCLNSRLKCDRDGAQKWDVIKKEELEILLRDEWLFKRLNICINRNYWVPEQEGGFFYLTYKIGIDKKGKLAFSPEIRESTAGAYCIFVRKMGGQSAAGL